MMLTLGADLFTTGKLLGVRYLHRSAPPLRSIDLILSFLVYTFSANAPITLQECRDKARENYPLVRRYDLIRATKIRV